jgi:hypothetical protein
LFPTGNTKIPKATTTRSIHSANIATDIHDEASKTPPIDQRDSEDQATVQTQTYDRHDAQSLPEDSTSTTGNERSGVSIRTSNWTTPLSKAIQHPRAMAPTTRTRSTQQAVDGILQLPDANPLFCCPFCDKAKMRKSHGGKRSTRKVFVPGTAFYMDLGFIRGPKNLQEVPHNGATPKETIIKSHNGFSSYLLSLMPPRDTSGPSYSKARTRQLRSSPSSSTNMEQESKE